MAKVLIIVENLPVPFDRRVWQEACALRDLGYQVTVICPQMKGFNAADEILEGIQIYRHPLSCEGSGVIGYLREYTQALWGEMRLAFKAWRKQGFDVIHLCNPPDILFLVALPYKLLGKKVIFDVHDITPELFEEKFGKRNAFYWMVRVAERLTLLLSNVVIATNQSVLDIVRKRGKKKAEDVFVVRTCPQKIDTTIAEDASLKKGRQYLAGYIGVMGVQDGVPYLLEMADYVVNKLGRKDVQFLLMGKGEDYEKVVQLRSTLGLEDYVDLPGRVSDEFLASALQTMDVGLACDPINDFNQHCTMNKTLEYMAFGKPQIMFEIREGRISAGEAAVYVAENSPSKFGDALLTLLGNEELRKQMGQVGRDRIMGPLSWEKSTSELKSAYERALGSLAANKIQIYN
jgi:glycosyltransferase involved in cell wall biosynthesis